MFGKIIFINDNVAHVENLMNKAIAADLMNVHVIFESENQKILGEVIEINDKIIIIKFLGEYHDKKFVNGVLRKPLLTSTIRVINGAELMELTGAYSDESVLLGTSTIYKDFKICPSINDMFSCHLAIFGNSGSGKSWGATRIIQNIFTNDYMTPVNANILIFDSYGEYKNAFRNLNDINPRYYYKFITTHKTEENDVLLKIPLHLLNLDDWSLLLQATAHSQLPIIDNTIKLAKIFAKDNDEANKLKNHIIAKALLAILFSSETTANKKNEIFTILEVCNTKEFNFNTPINGVGYSRLLSECFEIDSKGNFGESVLITDYILKHIMEDTTQIAAASDAYFTLKDFAKALDFTLIGEGFLHNESLYDDAIILKVRVNSLIDGSVGKHLSGEKYISLEDYLKDLVMIDNKKAQIININLEDIDDIYAKVIVKIFSRLIFEYSKNNNVNNSNPYHLFLEEAHRYIQKDNDTYLIGYNIFDRIAKEGRKYGVILDIISQRPVEISDTVIAQCSNFLIFKMTHPLDIKYIEEMLPNMSADIVDKQKILQPGTCVGFGTAFKIPMIIKLEKPNPTPSSTNCDVIAHWKA